MTQEIREVVGDILGLAPDEVDNDFSREVADNWDSLNHLRIITAVEQAFKVGFTMEEIQEATSVRRLQELVAAKSSGR
jgi:acyl carrier protein